MIRASQIKVHDLYYNETFTCASDYDWQVRASSLFCVSNINTALVQYRRHDQQISTERRSEQSFFADKVRIKQLSFLGVQPTEHEKELHLNFIKGINNYLIDDQWINRLLENNRRSGYYSQEKLQDFLQAHRYQYNYHNNRV